MNQILLPELLAQPSKNRRILYTAGRPGFAFFFLLVFACAADAQITLLKDYQNNSSAPIGLYQGVFFREAGFSSLFPIPNTNGTEYWTLSDRGPNIDDANANPALCRPTYDKMFPFPSYAPKIHRLRLSGDSVQILQTVSMKRPDGSDATGLMNPAGFGSTAAELISTDTVQNCANFNGKTVAKDIWGIDSEGILVDKEGNFWICEEGGPTVWKVSAAGVVLSRYTPYGNLPGIQAQDIAIDTVFKYRKNNRGFESIAITPGGKIYAFIQSPLLFPDAATGNATRIHRILEINPVNNTTRMLAYVNDGITGTAGSNQIRLQDWKLGDAAAVNDSMFLVLEAAARGTTDIKRMYLVNINQATPVTAALYSNKTLEGLVDEAGLAANGIRPVAKTLFMDLLANGWPSMLDKAEGLAIINDSTLAVCNDNDYGVASPNADGIVTATGNRSHVLVYGLKGSNKIPGYQALSTLPVQLNLFTGRAVAGKTVLNWKADETGTRQYEVERSPDGIRFNSILTLPASGKGMREYQAADSQPQAGSNYYRLKMIGQDGSFSYSAVLLVSFASSGRAGVVLYPNPVKDQLVISPRGFTGKISISITDRQGRLVLSKQIDAAATTLPLQHLPGGIYVIRLNYNGTSEVRKLVKE